MNRYAPVIVIASFLLGLAAPAWADLDEGIAAYRVGDYTTAMGELEPLAQRGNSEAQYYLGLMHNFRSGDAANPAESAKWLRRTAEQDHGYAQYALALMYLDGRGVKHSPADARYWFRRAVSNGVPEAQFYLPRRGRGR